MIWAVILAAGESRRMGESKMLLPFAGNTIIESVIDAAAESGVADTLVVLGAYREQIAARLSGRSVQTVFNPDYALGMLSSVQTGFRALPSECRAAVVLLGDQPQISSQTIDRLAGAFSSADKNIAVAVCRGRRGHPVLISTSYRDEIMELDPSIGLRQLLHNQPQDVLEVEIDDAMILQDINNPEDYEHAAKKD